MDLDPALPLPEVLDHLVAGVKPALSQITWIFW